VSRAKEVLAFGVSTALLASCGAKVEPKPVQNCNPIRAMNTIARDIEAGAGFKTLVLSPRKPDSMILVEDDRVMPIVNPLVMKCGEKIVAFVGRLHNQNQPETLELIEPQNAIFTVYTNKHRGPSSTHPQDLGVISSRHVSVAPTSRTENAGFNSGGVDYGIVVADALSAFEMTTLKDDAKPQSPIALIW
jgi:hypothetical protein